MGSKNHRRHRPRCRRLAPSRRAVEAAATGVIPGVEAAAAGVTPAVEGEAAGAVAAVEAVEAVLRLRCRDPPFNLRAKLW